MHLWFPKIHLIILYENKVHEMTENKPNTFSVTQKCNISLKTTLNFNKLNIAAQ